MYKIMYDIVVIIILWKQSFSMHIISLLTFLFLPSLCRFGSGRYICIIQSAFCMSECPCIQEFHLLWFHLMSHNISSLPSWMKHCTFQRLLATKRNLIVLFNSGLNSNRLGSFDSIYRVRYEIVCCLNKFHSWNNFYPRYTLQTDISCKSAIS